MRAIVSDGRMDRMYTIALDDGVMVRAWPRDVVVTHVQDIDPPAMLHRDRTAFLTGLERIVGAEQEHEDDVEDEEEATSMEVAAVEVPVGTLVWVPVVLGVAM